jgi:uroporphyrinogen decarboxylase
MRQAGRYMKEYQAIRQKYSFLEMCKIPEVAAEITLQPVNKLNVDAAILFSDILVPVEAMGIKIEFTKGEGPVLENPVSTEKDVQQLKVLKDGTEVSFVLETIRLLRKELADKLPLIGFSGAPFTLASYIIEGGGSKNYLKTKQMMLKNPALFHSLMEKITHTVIVYLKAQIDAGVQAIQLFDSWIGCLSPSDYETFVLPHSQKIFKSLAEKKIPTIHFAVNSTTLLKLMKKAGGDVIGIDWRINLDDAWARIGYDRGIQGNLDPVVLFSSLSEIEKRVKDILKKAANRPGHIFNLGHGVLPQTPVENVQALVDMVHQFSQR